MNSQKKVWIGIGSVVVLIVVLMMLGRPTGAPVVEKPLSGASGTLRVEGTAMHDFGSISMAQGSVTQVFTVKNTGTEPVSLRKMYTSCMCTTALFLASGTQSGPFGMPGHGPIPPLNRTLAPGESGEVSVVFDPAAHGPAGVGRITRSVYIEQAGQSPLELRISANVTP